MENISNTLNPANISLIDTVINRIQCKILSFGYQLVLLKSKCKKRLKIISRIFFFNF